MLNPQTFKALSECCFSTDTQQSVVQTKENSKHIAFLRNKNIRMLADKFLIERDTQGVIRLFVNFQIGAKNFSNRQAFNFVK